MKISLYIILLLIFGAMTANHAFGLDAPITTAGSSTLCAGNSFKVPITVNGFTDITAVSLRLDYNPSQVSFINASDITSNLPGGIIVNKIVVNSTLHKIMIIWSDVNPVTLNPETKLLDLNFTYLSGNPSITFNNTSNSGNDCEYADAIGDPMNDSPTPSFYFNASVSYMVLGTVAAIAGPTSVYPQSTESYSIAPITNATSYIWTIPDGSSGSSSSTSISIAYTPNSFSGEVTVKGQNVCGVTSTASLPVTVNKVFNLKFFLEGLYNSTSQQMNKAQDENGYHFSGDIADYYDVEFHSNAPPYQTIYTATNVGLKTDGTSQIIVPSNINGTYYIAIKNRNHVCVWSSQAVSLFSNLVAYDFTDNAAKAFGGNLKQLGANYLVPSGDINQDKVVDALDMISLDNASATSSLGYIAEDLNGDGIVNDSDMLLLAENANAFISVLEP